MVSMLSIGMINVHASDIETPVQNTMTVYIETGDGDTHTTTIDLNDCFSVTYDENGNIVPTPYEVSITENTIPSGHTVQYWYGNTEGCLLTRDTKVTIYVLFDKKINYEFGYIGGGYTTAVKSGKADYISTSFRAPADGYYKLYITNYSSDDVTVSGWYKY